MRTNTINKAMPRNPRSRCIPIVLATCALLAGCRGSSSNTVPIAHATPTPRPFATAKAYQPLCPEFAVNPDYKRREEILHLKVAWGKDDLGGTIQVDGMTFPILTKLFDEHFICPSERQNTSPTALAFLDFMRQYPAVIAHGYLVSPAREDYRISIEGLYVAAKDVTPDLKQAFIDFCRDADELGTDSDLLSWWD